MTSPRDREPGTPGADRSDDHAADGDDGADQLLLAHLRRLSGRLDPVPQEMAEASYGLLAWRDPDAALAALVADSRELEGVVRGGPSELLLRFEAEQIAITVEVNADGSGGYRLVGQVEPGGPGRLGVRWMGEEPGADELVVDGDEWGRFEAAPVRPGRISLRWTPHSDPAAPVQTSWVTI